MTDYIKIHGLTQPLRGTVTISPSKNGCLTLLPLCLVAPGVYKIKLPDITDIGYMLKILSRYNIQISSRAGYTYIDSTHAKINSSALPNMSKIRSSLYIVAATLPYMKNGSKLNFHMPGGCNFEARPIDQHILYIQALGYKASHSDDTITIYKPELYSNKDKVVEFTTRSFGATVGAIISAISMPYTTILKNTVSDPEIIHLIHTVNTLFKVNILLDADSIIVKGNENLRSPSQKLHTITTQCDRIEAGTFAIIGGCIASSNLRIQGIKNEQITELLNTLKRTGIMWKQEDEDIIISRDNKALQSTNVIADYFPAFDTDLQPQITSLLCKCVGTSVIQDNVFKARNSHVSELKKMQYDIHYDNNQIITSYSPRTYGASASSTDLRCGAALIIAALQNDGVSTIHGVEHIKRGYHNIFNKLDNIGANIM